MDSLHKQLHVIEKENFQSPFLHIPEKRLKPPVIHRLSAAMREFHCILKKFDLRLNLVVICSQMDLLLWDLRQVLSLNAWKQKNKNHRTTGSELLLKWKLMISLASLVHNEPEWCFPEVDGKYFHFTAELIGHPLITH